MYNHLQSRAAKEIAVLLCMHSLYKRLKTNCNIPEYIQQVMKLMHSFFRKELTKETNLLVEWTGAKLWK